MFLAGNVFVYVTCKTYDISYIILYLVNHYFLLSSSSSDILPPHDDDNKNRILPSAMSWRYVYIPESSIRIRLSKANTDPFDYSAKCLPAFILSQD